MKCGIEIIIDEDIYTETSNTFIINKVAVTDDCFEVEISAGGCSGNSWETALIGDIERIFCATPPLIIDRNIRFDLNNEEECDAWITKSFSFDISALQNEQVNFVYINIKDYDKIIKYEF